MYFAKQYIINYNTAGAIIVFTQEILIRGRSVAALGISPIKLLLSRYIVSSSIKPLKFGNDIFRIDVGSIEKGKYAKIMIVQYDPLWNIKLIKDVNFVMKGGEVYLK